MGGALSHEAQSKTETNELHMEITKDAGVDSFTSNDLKTK